jgi:hypothetical protein
MTDTFPTDPDLPERVVRLGREGLGRREIASKLGLSFAELEAMAAAQPGVAKALARAEDEARAWWEGLPRVALKEGGPFNRLAWREAMRARFGDPAKPTPPYQPPARFEFPDNGTRRKGWPRR